VRRAPIYLAVFILLSVAWFLVVWRTPGSFARAASRPWPQTTSAPTMVTEDEGKRLATARAAADQKWKDVREVKSIGSNRLKNLLPKMDLFCVAVFNPISVTAGRPTFLHTLVLTPGDKVFIGSDADACELLSKAGAKPADAVDALNATMAFGGLRNYPCRTRAPSGIPQKTAAKNWDIIIEEAKDGWSVSCTFMTDPTIQLCQRYHITITREGVLTAKVGEFISASGGYD
jgi:hypothetical protein